jgi:hypothetical protein
MGDGVGHLAAEETFHIIGRNQHFLASARAAIEEEEIEDS